MRCSNTRLTLDGKNSPKVGGHKGGPNETPFAVTVFYLLTVTNNAGQLAPITNAELPAPFTSPMSWSEGQWPTRRNTSAKFSGAPRQLLSAMRQIARLVRQRSCSCEALKSPAHMAGCTFICQMISSAIQLPTPGKRV